jgi:hypothetical protein
MKATCQCGDLVATIAPDAQGTLVMCHCEDCQRRSGSPFGSIMYFAADEVTIEGEAHEYTRPTDSGFTFTNGFCPRCGSSVYARSNRLPELRGVMSGAFADPAIGQPVRSVYEQGKHHWLTLPDDMAHHMRGRDS